MSQLFHAVKRHRSILAGLGISIPIPIPGCCTEDDACGIQTALISGFIEVEDLPACVDPEALNKIFSPFYTSKTSGTGLGLAISKKLVDAHGGSIELESGELGARFLIRLPTAR